MLKTLAALQAVFTPPSAATLAQNELEDAERALLKAQSGREYAEAMVTYHQRRISRLKGILPTVQAANEATPVRLQRAA